MADPRLRLTLRELRRDRAYRRRIMRLVRLMAPAYAREVEALYGRDLAEEMLPELLRQTEELVVAAPYIGGRSNRLSRNLYLTAPLLALHRGLQARGKPLEEIAGIIYRGTAAAYAHPAYAALLRLQGALLFTRLGRARLRRDAARRQLRRYPDDWVMEVVEGEGFELGVDYTECGIVKYLKANGAPELAPYLCLLDYPMCDRMHVHLDRAETIAAGGERCTFRFQRWAGPHEVALAGPAGAGPRVDA
ncbi:MAG: L-2-amino-thiazoline-4-carboxylic acid hydrolase [Brachybacterium paraconglomeratum]|nr:L-2-amino-thiazoline-4-carboxylic acid hydrolase [Brachybacterium paraconglomeratum]